MNAPIIIGTGAALALLAWIGRVGATQQRRGGGRLVHSEYPQGLYNFDGIYQGHAAAHGLDWKLLKAIAIVESGEDPQAVNPSDPSTGLMQILCEVGPDGRCKNKLNLPGWPPRQEELFDPDTNVRFAAGILKWNIKTYGKWRGVAVYNRWASRRDPINGPFGNQSYVDKVRREYINLGGTP